ncbi:MAG: hypothetical protein MUP66_00975 [Candidatus Nanohaloarchaeota archaeon QJJ-5]|nr:hypothetical protein [Candidatus Nanohaloarchaeota archaeon QJJ-5]
MRFLSIVLVGVVIIGMAGTSMAQEIQKPDNVDPGMITPSSILYAVERIVDTFLLHLGLISGGELANERASEAYVMYERGQSDNMIRATASMAQIVSNTGEKEIDKLSSAQEKLAYLNAVAPEERQISVALQDLRNRVTQLNGTERQIQPAEPDDEEQVNVSHQLHIRNDSYSEQEITVAPNEVIQITNNDVYRHNIRNDRVVIDKDVGPKESTTVRFYREGTFELSCVYHDDEHVRIHVTE